MSGTTAGVAIGAVLAFAALQFGFWGFLLFVIFILIGGAIGRFTDGKLDLQGVADALRGRRSSS